MADRIQKTLAHAGFGSRREIEAASGVSVARVDDKFNRQIVGGKDTEFRQATYGLKTREEFMAAKTKHLDGRVGDTGAKRKGEEEARLRLKRRRKKKAKKVVLSFGGDDDEEEEEEAAAAASGAAASAASSGQPPTPLRCLPRRAAQRTA